MSGGCGSRCIGGGSGGDINGGDGGSCHRISVVGEAVLGPSGRLGAPNGNLMEVVTIGKLVWAPIKDVKPLTRLGKVSRLRRALGDPLGQSLSVVSAGATLPLEEPLAVQEVPVNQPVVDILLPCRSVLLVT